MGQSRETYEIAKRSIPFKSIKDLDPLIESCKDKKIVMLGESTHGTKEFYEWRNIITSELIQKHGFNFIAIEGDWPACQEVNKFIQRHSKLGSLETLSRFSRWPTWMWANYEMVGMLDWLYEQNLLLDRSIGFHGLDVYSLFESVHEVINLLNGLDPMLANKVKDFYSCFDPYEENEKAYARSLFSFPTGCENEVTEAMKAILENSLKGPGNYFNANQNARIIKNAESYYRAVIFNDKSNSWNIRDKHMMETLENLLDFYSYEGSKGIVWAHNSHIGDYRATNMEAKGKINLGGLAREKFGHENVSLIGLTTYTGSVMASHAWGGAMEVMQAPEAKIGSLESSLHNSVPMIGHPNFYLMFDEVEPGTNLLDLKGHRSIGVVYDPNEEKQGNYVPTAVAKRYNALIYMDETQALTPIRLEPDLRKIPETYPEGLSP